MSCNFLQRSIYRKTKSLARTKSQLDKFGMSEPNAYLFRSTLQFLRWNYFISGFLFHFSSFRFHFYECFACRSVASFAWVRTHKTRSRSRAFFYVCAIRNCACPLIVYALLCVVLWKLDAHQPVKPPFSTALNKTMRFMRSGSEVLRCAIRIVAYQPPTPSSFFNLLFTFSLYFCSCFFVEWIYFDLLSTRSSLYASPSQRSFVRTICALSTHCCYAFAYWSALSDPSNVKSGKKGANR